MDRLKKLLFYCVAASFVIISACTNPVELNYEGPDNNKSNYGPRARVYEIPQTNETVYYVAPNALNLDAKGTSPDSPITLEAAIAKAVSGDVIILRGGEYRTGNLTFNQGITIQPYADEKPVLKGTYVANDWSKPKNNLWCTNWDYLFPGTPESWWVRERNEKYTPLHRFNNDGVFIDGQYLQSVGSIDDVTPETYFVDYTNNKIYIGTNPDDKLVEITAFRKAIMRTTDEVHGKKSDGIGPVIRGITITQYPDTMVHIDGFYPQGISDSQKHGNDVVGTVFEDCTFSKCFRIGVFAIGDSMIMRHCKIEDSNTEGLYIVASDDVLLERNIFAHNNIERWTGFFPAAVKIFNQSHRVVCRNNLVIDHPVSSGIWYDVGNVDGVFINNWIENVGDVNKTQRTDQVWPSNNGFFFEISKGALCAGNVFLNCDQGMLILNSCDVKVYNNSFINSTACFGRNSRGDDADHFGWHIRTGPGVDERSGHAFVNNLIYMDEDQKKPFLNVWQPADMCDRLNEPTLSVMNNNSYVRMANSDKSTLILWTPAQNDECQKNIQSPEELNALYSDFATKSNVFENIDFEVFVDYSSNNFVLNQEFKAKTEAAEFPANIIEALRLNENADAFIGAY